MDIDPDDFKTHYECARLAPAKEIWDKALNDGEKIPCPKCGGGRKDNGCTHMTCVKCRTSWCYLCGLPENKLDKANGVPNMMGHNDDWQNNSKRCPLYLNDLFKIDKRWPKQSNHPDDDSSEECVVFLHRLRTKQLLKEAIKKIGDNTYKELCKKYGIDKNCGYDIKNDVLKNDHSLVKYVLSLYLILNLVIHFISCLIAFFALFYYCFHGKDENGNCLHHHACETAITDAMEKNPIEWIENLIVVHGVTIVTDFLNSVCTIHRFVQSIQ